MAALESGAPSPAASAAVAHAAADRPPDGGVEPKAAVRVEALPLIGRTLLALAGAFLLRAVTESQALPRGPGTALGLAYAVAWLILAERAARAARVGSATFHVLAASIIAYPLVWESTVKFRLFPAPLAAAILLGVTAAGLGIATWRRLERSAWVVVAAAVLTSLALGFATRELVLFASLVLVLGLVTLWLAYHRGWSSLAWTTAAFADLTVLFLGGLVLAGHAERVQEIAHPQSVVTLQLALVLVYCGSLGARTLARRAEVELPEIAQGATALLVGLGGALAVQQASGFGGAALGAVAATLAVACYAAAFAFVDRVEGGRRNFIFYTTLALVFTLVALDTLLAGGAFVGAVALLALATAWLGAVRGRATLTLHGAVYTVVAALGSGLAFLVVEALAATTPPGPDRLGPVPIVALAVALACTWLPVATHGRTWGAFSRAPKLVVTFVAVLGLDAFVVILGATLLPRVGDVISAAGLATLRTSVLALTALLLAGASRLPRFVEARWLVYPALVAGGLKLIAEDVAAGRAATLVLSFAMYGGALIVAPRVIGKGPPQRDPTA